MKTRLVVVGGGTAGAGVVRRLCAKLDASKFELFVVTAHPTHVYLPALLRLLVKEDASMDSVFMPFDKLFGSFPGVLKIAEVKAIHNKAEDGKKGVLTLTDDTQLSYDVLFVATGSSREEFLSLPTEKAACKAHIEGWRSKIRGAENIVIVGGGAVGIETAGEINEAWPKKSVTIVHNQALLTNSTYPDKFRLKLQQKLKERGIKVVLGDNIHSDTPLEGKISTQKGVELKCDLLIPARGGKPNAAFMSSLEPNPLDESGFVKVTPTLQVESHSNIFAAGDIISWPEVKQFAKVGAGHIPVIESNIEAFLHNRPLTKRYAGFMDVLVTTIGSKGGVSFLGMLWGLVFGDFTTKTLKSKDLMAPKQRKELGLN